MKGWEVGDKVGEDGRHASDELGVDQADARDAGDAKAGAEGKQPLHGHLVLEVEFVLLGGTIVPHVHNGHGDAGQHKGHPPALVDLEERWG